jgi:signal peptidase I
LINLEVDGFIRKFIIKGLSTDTYGEISDYILNISNNGENEYLIYTTDKGIPIKLVRELRLDIREIIDKEKELSLTHIDAIKIKNSNQFDTIYRTIQETDNSNSIFFPNNTRFNWNNDHFGPLYIPKAGDKIDLNIKTLPLYKKIITDYEFNDLLVVEEDILINGVKENEYVFKQDYYWMMGDNRYNSEDSRVWGFVPFDHVLGRPVFIWMSIEGLFNGMENWKFRWDRVFTTIGFDGKPRSYLPHFIIFIVGWQLYLFIKKRRRKKS